MLWFDALVWDPIPTKQLETMLVHQKSISHEFIQDSFLEEDKGSLFCFGEWWVKLTWVYQAAKIHLHGGKEVEHVRSHEIHIGGS